MLNKPGNEVFGATAEEMIWYNYDTSNKKHWYTLVNHLQKICRSTLEYDYWQRACKYKDAKDCPVCDENYYEKNSECESHHHPKTLKVIIEEILEKHIEDNDLDDKTGLEIVDEVMALHVTGQVHYINLCVFCHKKFHKDHPDVVDKIDEIFEKRAQEGQRKWENDYKDGKAKVEPIINEGMIPFEKQESSPPIDGVSTLVLNETAGYIPVPQIVKDGFCIDIDIDTKPEKELVKDTVEVFNETSTGFESVSIDIEKYI